MREVTGISGVVLKKWIAWYCHNSKYYDLHKVGATRFNLDGTKAGIVTEKHQKYRNKDLVQTKKLQTKEVDKRANKEAAVVLYETLL